MGPFCELESAGESTVAAYLKKLSYNSPGGTQVNEGNTRILNVQAGVIQTYFI
jgi:hypothetical protein